jgi:vacuolar-type H+-ATPase subunit C/Vma6
MEQFNATDLLEKGKDLEYPSDYLLSRIRGRKGRFIQDWTPLIVSPAPLEHLPECHYYQRFTGTRSPEGVWRALLNEYRWVYYQMNGRLRNIFGPFFLYAELRTLFICLRSLKEMNRARVREMFSASLLSEELSKIISDSADESAAAQAIETKLKRLSAQFSGITEILRQKGLSGFEHELTKRYLCVIVGAGLDPVLQAFFIRLIDARNALALAKLLRLDKPTEHAFIPGGTIDAARLKEILDSKSRPELERVLREMTEEQTVSADLVKLEAALYRGITRSLKKAGRSPLSIGPILEYLWGCSVEAMNLSVLCYSQGMERDLVAAELAE